MAKTLVLGYGKMGQIYVKTLQSYGITGEGLIVVDKDPARLLGFKPPIQTFTELDEALRDDTIKTAFVLSNTNFHRDHITRILNAGVDHIFVEKPLVFRSQELECITAAMRPQSKIFTAYLLNFSPAVGYLALFMKERGLDVLEVRGVWGKNRSFDTRMTAGDLEDEAVHMVQLALTLARQGMKIDEIIVSAMLSYLPYASSEAQAKGHAEDASVPLLPSSSTLASMRLYSKWMMPAVFCSFMSSYLSPFQTRFVDVVLGRHSDCVVTHVGRMQFDTDGKDSLSLQQTGAKEFAMVEHIFPADGKIRDEVGAFLATTRGEQADPRLTEFKDAALSVKLTEAFLESGKDDSAISLDV